MAIPILRKPRFAFVYVLALLPVFAARTTDAGLHWGAIIVLIGELIRLWANGYVGHVKVNRTEQQRGDAKIGRLITAGPYAFVRHPLYFGTFLIGVGLCVIVGRWWFGLLALACFLVLYRRKMAEEEQRILNEWPHEYAAYRRHVSQWLPLRSRYADRTGQWSWQGIAASKEWKTVIWTAVVVIALYLRAQIVQEHHWHLPMGDRAALRWLYVMLALMATDGMIELIVRRSAKRTRAGATA
ncbi:MAG: isoprenylcysteine carboxylmethyltransferase family protein [Candidatus Omnitrophica bacterium]|nr:isoprenylcysteine carboxylmethyltransferase family protein [Candidatus Omnitrophota bacterium]